MPKPSKSIGQLINEATYAASRPATEWRVHWKLRDEPNMFEYGAKSLEQARKHRASVRKINGRARLEWVRIEAREVGPWREVALG